MMGNGSDVTAPEAGKAAGSPSQIWLWDVARKLDLILRSVGSHHASVWKLGRDKSESR